MPKDNDPIETVLKDALIKARLPFCKWVLKNRKDAPDLFYLDFLETKSGTTEVLEDEAFEEFEAHIGQCHCCQRHVARAAAIMVEATGFDDGFNRVAGSGKSAEKDFRQIEKGKIIELKRDQEKDASDDRMYLLAASSDQRIADSKMSPGLAYGVAVSKEDQRGRSVVEILTDVNEGKGELGIDLFEQLEGFEVGGQMQLVTSKKAMLEDHIKSVLKTSRFFTHLNVHRKNISLRLNLLSKKGVISDIESLELACLVSIASCLCGKGLKSDTAFTGRVLKSGNIAGVGDFDKKINFLEECGFKDIYVPKENAKEALAIQTGIVILPADSIDMLFEKLGFKAVEAQTGFSNFLAALFFILGAIFFLLQLIRWLG